VKNLTIGFAALVGLLVGVVSTNWAYSGLTQAKTEQNEQPKVALDDDDWVPGTGHEPPPRCCACPEPPPPPPPVNCGGALRDPGCP